MKKELDELLQEYAKNQINLCSSVARSSLIEDILKIIDNYYEEDKIDR